MATTPVNDSLAINDKETTPRQQMRTSISKALEPEKTNEPWKQNIKRYPKRPAARALVLDHSPIPHVSEL